MSYLKTKETDSDVSAFINAIEDSIKREDCIKLITMLEDISGFKAKIWGARIIGFGSYIYKTKAGKEGEWFLIGFSPTKANISLHLMFGLEDETELLSKLGKHKMGKGCVYINKLADVDMTILKQLMIKTYARMKMELK